VRKDFRRIRIDTETADITFALATDGVCRLEYTETEDETYVVAVVDDTLTVQFNDTREWYQHINFGFSDRDETLTVYLPKAEYDALEIEESTGDIEIPKGFAFSDISIATGTGDISCRAISEEMTIASSTGNITVADVSAGSITLSASTGRVQLANVSCIRDLSVAVSTGRTELENVQCRNFISTGSTGRLVMKNVIALGKLSVKRSTGDVTFDRCDAVDISVETSTGDVTGTLLTDKIFFTDTNTGDVDVPKTTTGGTCEITTTTGDIEIEIG
jgi:DUF4097 and DUF4098 domain-containing protein YvlB